MITELIFSSAFYMTEGKRAREEERERERKNIDDDCCHSSELAQDREIERNRRKGRGIQRLRERRKEDHFDDCCGSLSYLDIRQDSC